MKITLATAFVLVLTSHLSLVAQDKIPVKFGTVTPADFSLPASPAIDSNTNAVIIADLGVTTFKGNKLGWVSYVYKRKARIKILNKKGFDLATVKIRLYTYDEQTEVIDDFSAYTYNLENGKVVTTKMEKKDMFSNKLDKNRIEQKFTVPGVKENSIIEYSYTVISDFYFNIPSWQFQNIDYPSLWSEYQVTIPSLVGYVFNKRGVHKFDIDKADEGHESYLIREKSEDAKASIIDNEHMLSVNASTVKHRWVMKDVPAFYVENYITTPENYLDQIDFQLARTYNGESTREVKNTWEKATEDMLKEKDFAAFGTDESETFWLDKPVEDITRASNSSLQSAKDIYYYLTNNFTCTNHHSKYITTTLKDVYKKQKGEVGEINLLLTAMLQKKHITAAPVVLSTREYGYNYASYPILGRLDYVICKATIEGKEYYLDASYPLLGFGHLPPNCYNGHARVISMEDAASVYFLADSIKEHRGMYVSIMNSEKKPGTMEGSYANTMGFIESFKLRTELAAVGKEQYFKNFRGAPNDAIIVNDSWIDSLKKPEDPLKLNIDFSMPSFTADDIIYFSPLLWAGYKTNPFSAAVRKYPVEMPYPVNETYTLMMEIPTGFVVDEIPKSTRVSYNGQEGFFEYLVQKDANVVQLRCSIVMKKANFDPEEYDALRQFYGFIVKKQSEQIVFKRKK